MDVLVRDGLFFLYYLEFKIALFLVLCINGMLIYKLINDSNILTLLKRDFFVYRAILNSFGETKINVFFLSFISRFFLFPIRLVHSKNYS